MRAFASVEIIELLPNPAGKDEDGEYIEIRNTGCESVDISGYNLSDASSKTYIIPSWTILNKQENRRFPYSETKIGLNNSGDEAVYLRDMSGNMIDEVHYSETQKDDVVITISLTDEVCISPEETSSWNTDSSTGEVLTDSGITEQNPLNPPSEGGSGTTETGTGEVLTDSGSNSWTGEIFENYWSGEVLSDSWSTEIGSGLTETGAVSNPSSEEDSETGTWTPLDPPFSGGLETIETGTLTPIEMYYSDSDGNNRIDTFEIIYPYVLTGGVNTGAIELYSNTGGLFSYRVNTLTGYIVDGFLSGNVLVLRILEGDIDKTTLRVNNTTSSEIRLKSSVDLGFRSLGGQIPESFFLTKSFDEYRNVSMKYEVWSMNSETGTWATGSGTEQNPPNPLSQGGNENTETGTVAFPELIPTFQNYTNTTNSWDLLTCTTMPCRVNFTLEPIFTGTFLEKDFSCQITFGTGVYNTCNPPQLYPTSSGSIEILLTDKATGTSTGRSITITMNLITANNPTANVVPVDNHTPIAMIDMDGSWKKYFTSPDANLLRCYAFTCSVNFTWEHSYDPDGDELRFLWFYDYTTVSTKKDPGTRIFTIGTHTILFRVIDIYGAFGEVRYMIEVLHPDLRPKEEAEKKEKVEKKKTETKKTTKKKKVKPMVFFDAPDILIQNKNPSNIQIAGNRYTCYTKTKTCSINFTLTGAQSWYTYEWSFPGQSGSYISKNPRSFAFPVGASDVRLVVRDLAGNILVSQDMDIQVIKTTKTRGVWETVAKKEATTIPAVISPATDTFSNETNVTASNPWDDSLLFLLFLSGSGLAGYVRVRRKAKFKNKD